MSLPRVLVFASGTKTGGGSGFENLVKASRDGRLHAEIVGVVSNHANGGVREKADRLEIPFWTLGSGCPWDAAAYKHFAWISGADFFALSGWLKLVTGLDLNTRFNSRTVFNIHPGPLPTFGGPGMYGHHVHEAVLAAYGRKEVICSKVSMHFVTEQYDLGPVFFEKKVEIYDDDTPETLAKRVNAIEHEYQPRITDMVVNGLITWDGKDPNTLLCPESHFVSQMRERML